MQNTNRVLSTCKYTTFFQYPKNKCKINPASPYGSIMTKK